MKKLNELFYKILSTKKGIIIYFIFNFLFGLFYSVFAFIFILFLVYKSSLDYFYYFFFFAIGLFLYMFISLSFNSFTLMIHNLKILKHEGSIKDYKHIIDIYLKLNKKSKESLISYADILYDSIYNHLK